MTLGVQNAFKSPTVKLTGMAIRRDDQMISPRLSDTQNGPETHHPRAT